MDSNNQRKHFNKKQHRYNMSYLERTHKMQTAEYQEMEQLLHLPFGSRIIDFGSGNGRVALYFLGRGYHVHAVDISKPSILELTKLYKKLKTSFWGTLTTSTILPSSHSYDGIVGADILHHVDISTILPELKKAIKKSGVLVFSEPNGWNPFWYVYILLKRLPWNIEKNIMYTNPVYITRKFQKAGYTHIHIKGISILVPILRYLPSHFTFPSYLLAHVWCLPTDYRMIVSTHIK